MYVIKFNDKYYWCGYNTCDTQLRKAVIYKSIKIAEYNAKDCIERKSCIKTLQEPITYKIVEVELKEVE